MLAIFLRAFTVKRLERKNWLKALMYSKAAELFQLELKADRIAREMAGKT